MISNMVSSECNTQQHIQITIKQNVATLTLSNGGKKNALSKQMLIEMTQWLNDTLQDQSFKVLLIDGDNHCFSAGADLDWMKEASHQTIEQNLADARLFFDFYNTLNHYPKPVVVKVERFAMGGAIGIMACADVVVADTQSKYAFSEVKLGLVPATIAPFVLRKTGQSAARRLMLTAETFDVAEAQFIGLVHTVADATQLDNAVNEVITQLLNNSAEAMASTKYMLNKLTDNQLPSNYLSDFCTQMIASARASVDGQEGVKAFFEKRKPNWHEKH